MNKKAFLNISKTNLLENLTTVEDLSEQGYELYAEGETALFFNKNMIPTNTLFDFGMKFDYVLC